MFPLAVQIPGIALSDEKAFVERLKVLSHHKFMGIEYTPLLDMDKEDAAKVKRLCSDHNLRVTRIASGGLAVREKLSLSDSGETGKKTVSRLKDFIDYAAELNAAIVMGFIKGPAGLNKQEAAKVFTENLLQVSAVAARKNVILVIESTNHYETSVACNLAESVALLQAINPEGMQILPDTYHMNIEEANLCAMLCKYRDYYSAVHLSDNNRFFPGYGALDFKQIISALAHAGFQGYLGLEGNIKKSFADDMRLFCDMYSVIERSIQS